MWRLEPHSPSMRTACFWSAPGNEGRGWFRDAVTEAAVLNICGQG
jgi:hypothetical protein